MASWDTNGDIGAKLVEEYMKLLIEGHGENCAWRNKGCDGEFFRHIFWLL